MKFTMSSQRFHTVVNHCDSMHSALSSQHSHTVVSHCDYTQVKIHTVAELLLLSGSLRLIRTENTVGLENRLFLKSESADVVDVAAWEQINSSLNIITEIVSDISRSMGELKTRWKVICEMLFRLGDAVTVLIELCYFVTFQSLTSNKSENPQNVLVDKYAASFAGLEIKLSCVQLKRAHLNELTATFIMDICSNISKYISLLTENCKTVSEQATDHATRDQFKLGIKSVTCAAGSLIASIKSYKADRSATHHTRVVTFCEPVLAASHALVCLATEDEFTEPGRELSVDEKEIQNSVFGPCMNIVSGCVQICKTLRDFTYDSNNSHYLHKARSAVNSIQRSTSQLKHHLKKHFQMEFHVKASSPTRLEEDKSSKFDSLDEKHENNQELLPFNSSSEKSLGSLPFNRSTELLTCRTSPQPSENCGKDGILYEKSDLSTLSSVTTSDTFVTSSGSVSQ